MFVCVCVLVELKSVFKINDFFTLELQYNAVHNNMELDIIRGGGDFMGPCYPNLHYIYLFFTFTFQFELF